MMVPQLMGHSDCVNGRPFKLMSLVGILSLILLKKKRKHLFVVCMCAYHSTHVEMGQQFAGVGSLSLHPVGLSDPTEVVRLDGRRTITVS